MLKISQQPAQAQEGILLRAVAKRQEKREEQPLKASGAGMSGLGNQRDALKVTAAACLVCIFAMTVLSVLMRTIWIPQATRHSHTLSCLSNRRIIGEQEKLYKQNSPAHQYTTSLQQLGVPRAYTVCPENGVYCVVIVDNQVEVHCSIKEHNIVIVK